ncbi:MAG: DNA polymerase/3'-5' exonuclease PolX [Nevskia sp.]|nr:DNA polymerase/3'-5' exonuclease PolX [Nevskia sp.]
MARPVSKVAAPRHAADNERIAAIFEEIADLLDLQNANPFRIRAYRNAARSVRAFGPDIGGLLGSGRELPKLPGIGRDLTAKIGEIVETGSCALLERLRKQVPGTLVELLSIPGLGPKRVQHLYHELGVETPQQLRAAARDGRLDRLHGFGPRMQAKLLQAVDARLQTGHRHLLALAAAPAERVVSYLRRAPGVSEVSVAGSFRRMRDTVGDLDILAAAADPDAVTRHFLGYPEVREVLAGGPARASVVLESGLQVDLRTIDPPAWGAALVYFTGSKAHNIALRRRAQERGFKLSEYGVFKDGRRVAGDTEASVYRILRLAEIPPELREDRGEIEAAEAGRLPRLIEPGDLRGDLHAHSKASDGANSLEEMAEAARAAGLEYLAITDHSRHLRIAHGLDAAALLRQCEEIDALNRCLRGITLLKGAEVDILENGELDLPDEALQQLDLVVGAVHDHFGLSRTQQTRRLLRAMEHRCFTVLAHPFARLIGEREPIEVDMTAVIKAARQRGCALELNAQPRRMDLFDIHCRAAKEQGVPVSIDSDAHRAGDFAQLRFGVGQARRGWLEKDDVLNTRGLQDLRRFLRDCRR